MGTRVLSKKMKIVEENSTENCHFYSHEKSLYIAWACYCNATDSWVTDLWETVSLEALV